MSMKVIIERTTNTTPSMNLEDKDYGSSVSNFFSIAICLISQKDSCICVFVAGSTGYLLDVVFAGITDRVPHFFLLTQPLIQELIHYLSGSELDILTHRLIL